jgi:hypothetical protein
VAIVDIGAYDFIPVVFSPEGLNFGVQPVGSSTSKAITLTNAQNKVLNLFSISVATGYSVRGCGASLAAFTSCTLTVTLHPLTATTFEESLLVWIVPGIVHRQYLCRVVDANFFLRRPRGVNQNRIMPVCRLRITQLPHLNLGRGLQLRTSSILFRIGRVEVDLRIG